MGLIRDSYLAAAEPSWARQLTEWQLQGLLNLNCLLSPRVFLSDVHLGDNGLIFKSYVNNPQNGLFAQIIALAKSGVVAPLLRDKTLRIRTFMEVVNVNSFSDVYSSWKTLDPPDAWITISDWKQRDAYFSALDARLGDTAIIRYDYERIKRNFMDLVRQTALRDDRGWFANSMRHLSVEQWRRYEALINKEWFSLADLYSLLQQFGVADIGLSPLLVHGLLNEASYSHAIGANFTGFDTERSTVETAVWNSMQAHNSTKVSVDAFLERSSAVMSAPSLSLVAMLRPEEIVDIRKLGRGYFELASHKERNPNLTDDIDQQFVRETTEYWESACDYIGTHHKSIAKKPSRLALYLKELPAPFSLFGEDAFRFIMSLAVEAELGGGSTLKGAVSRVAQFIFVADRDEMSKLREVLPKQAWSRDRLPGIGQSLVAPNVPRRD